jgi:hypothetical protein
MVVEALFVGALTWLLYKSGKGPKAPGTATKPSKAAWPKEGVAPAAAAPPPPLSPDDKASIAQNEAQHGAETSKFQAEKALAVARAGQDKAAQADIARRAAERQKALDDWKRDIEAAKRGEGRG